MNQLAAQAEAASRAADEADLAESEVPTEEAEPAPQAEPEQEADNGDSN